MIGFGQNVNIPDANFKAYLVGNSLINTNGDSEIQVSEATAFNGSISCSSLGISDLTGIEAFPIINELYCDSNQLTNLDVRNGNNSNFLYFLSSGNPNLACIDVDDVNYSTTNWLNIDAQHYFSINCPPPSAIQEHTINKELLKVTDLLGRETKQTNQLLFYIYDDGTVEKRIVIE